MAVNAEQVGRLDNLHDRGIKNEVPDLKVVGPDEIRDIEPNCVVNMMLYCSLTSSSSGRYATSAWMTSTHQLISCVRKLARDAISRLYYRAHRAT